MEVQSNEDPLEVLNWHLRRAMEELDQARNPEAVWGPSQEPLRVVEQVTAARKYLGHAEVGAVALLREAGASWQQIGDALGVTRQAAQMRFGKVQLHRV